MRNDSGFTSPSISRKLQPCPQARSCRTERCAHQIRSLPIGVCMSCPQPSASSRPARPPQQPRPVPRLEARGPNQVGSWDNSYLPTSLRGVWLYLYLVIDIWSRKVVAWDKGPIGKRPRSPLISSAGPAGAVLLRRRLRLQQGPPPTAGPPCR